MKKPRQYNITPAKGQALLDFQGRRFPSKIDIFETEIIEEVKNTKVKEQSLFDKETKLNSDFKNLLIQGDCLSACAYLKSKNIKVDLVYIDPPFASGANYAKKIYLRNGSKSDIEADDSTIGEEIMYDDIWQKEDYLNWLYERLLAIKDIMNETGSIYIHLDTTIGHYVKVIMDEIFGEENFKNEFVWCYRGMAVEKKHYLKRHDSILYYSKSNNDCFFDWEAISSPLSKETIKKYKNIDEKGRHFRLHGRNISGSPIQNHTDIDIKWLKTNPELCRVDYLDEKTGTKPKDWLVEKDWIVMDYINVWSTERVWYPTQKPEDLINMFIKASSSNGMIVADFFCGSGTTAKVAHDLKRKFIACDIGINAIQTTRDRLVKVGTSFDIIKINDGLRLFRNPAQTTAKIFSIIDGFKTRVDLGLNEFWDGGIAQAKGSYTPVKFTGIHDKLAKELLDVYLEEIYKLEDTTNNASEVIIIYAHKDIEIDQKYINKQINKTAKTELKVHLVSLDSLLGEKREALFTPDNAGIKITKQGNKYKVEIKKFFSPYLKNKIDDYNAKKTKKGTLKQDLSKAVIISENGLELIEAVQFDTTLTKIWKSNQGLEDKAGIKEKIRGTYLLDTDKFKIKIRNIAGDEIIINSGDIK